MGRSRLDPSSINYEPSSPLATASSCFFLPAGTASPELVWLWDNGQWDNGLWDNGHRSAGELQRSVRRLSISKTPGIWHHVPKKVRHRLGIKQQREGNAEIPQEGGRGSFYSTFRHRAGSDRQEFVQPLFPAPSQGVPAGPRGSGGFRLVGSDGPSKTILLPWE